MDWPDMGGRSAHFDKRFLEDYLHRGWGYLVERYGEASVAWFAAAVFYGYPKGGAD